MKTTLEYTADNFDIGNLPIWVIPQVNQVRKEQARRISYGDATPQLIAERTRTVKVVDFIRWDDECGVLYLVLPGATLPIPVIIQKSWMNLKDVGSRARFL